jgi:hypothetical protein
MFPWISSQGEAQQLINQGCPLLIKPGNGHDAFLDDFPIKSSIDSIAIQGISLCYVWFTKASHPGLVFVTYPMYIHITQQNGDIRWDTYQAKPPFWRSGNGDETISWMVSNLNWLKSRKKLSCSSSWCACVRTADQNMPRSSKIIWCVKMIPSVRQKKSHGTILGILPILQVVASPTLPRRFRRKGSPKMKRGPFGGGTSRPVQSPATSHQPPPLPPRQLRQY